MNKKLVFVLFAILLVAVVAFAACNLGNNSINDPNNQDSTRDILDLYDAISDAKSATQVITVNNALGELAKETRSYNFVTGTVEITRKVLNSSDADELYTTTTETKAITDESAAKITKDSLTNVTQNDNTLKATVVNANLNEVFGIQSSDVQGDAKIEIVAQGSHIVSITVTYTSSNGNAVAIVTTYVY